jgi:hypothetical protein
MSEHETKLSDLERLLAALPPRPASLDRDRLLFRAGQASMKRSWAWPLAAVTMAATTGCLATMLLVTPAPAPIVRIVRVEVPAAAPAPAEDSEPAPQPPAPVHLAQASVHVPPMSYWRLQHQAMRFGVDGLPCSACAADDEPASDKHVEAYDLSAGSRPGALFQPLSPFGERQ